MAPKNPARGSKASRQRTRGKKGRAATAPGDLEAAFNRVANLAGGVQPQGDPLAINPSQAALGTGPVTPVASGSFFFSGIFLVLFAIAVFKAIHKILRFVHDEDIRQRDAEPRLYDNPIKEQLRNPKNALTTFKDSMFEKTLEFADNIDEGLKNTALKVVEKGIKPAFEALGDVELG